MDLTVNLGQFWLQTPTSCIVQISVNVCTCLMHPPLWEWTDMLCLLTIYTFIDVNVCKNSRHLVKIEITQTRKSVQTSIYYRVYTEILKLNRTPFNAITIFSNTRMISSCNHTGVKCNVKKKIPL